MFPGSLCLLSQSYKILASLGGLEEDVVLPNPVSGPPLFHPFPAAAYPELIYIPLVSRVDG